LCQQSKCPSDGNKSNVKFQSYPGGVKTMTEGKIFGPGKQARGNVTSLCPDDRGVGGGKRACCLSRK